MPIIEGFRATTVWKAFILNSLASSIIILLAIVIKERFDTFHDKKGHVVTRTTSKVGLFVTFLITFLASFAAFSGLHFLVGYGGGMTVQD